ncbi:Imm27 family immunity protein [Rhizobium bangladeshense]|uniref:Imm27 family immunity protein n=1 Tax=Rhizobium bangladeshense TaxID=1138189 RepID=UPI0018D42571
MRSKNEYIGLEALSRTKSLSKIKTEPDSWKTEYRDDATGETWILDYPHSEEHGGGSPRLRRKPR